METRAVTPRDDKPRIVPSGLIRKESIRDADDRSRLYLGVYRFDAKTPGYSCYVSFVGNGADFEERIWLPPESRILDVINYYLLVSGRLVALKKIPKIWEADMEMHMAHNPLEGSQTAPVGYIDYCLSGGVRRNKAVACEYFPREWIGKGVAKGITYYLEAIATSHLQERGVDIINSSSRLKPERIRQLERVGLRGKADTEIGRWLKAMGHGLSLALQYHANRLEAGNSQAL